MSDHSEHIEGLDQVLHRYDGLVVDLWGVMHNGKALFPQAVAALEQARAMGKAITFLSNAPRRRTAALNNLTGNLGLNPDLIDDLITSGEITWQALANGAADDWGHQAYFFGAAKDLEIQEGLPGLRFVSTLAQADWILNVGPEPGCSDVAPFQPWIRAALDRGLPMVCANPDLKVQRGHQQEICAGSLGHAYAEQGGQVIWYGKPHSAVYEAVYASCGLPASRLLAIGDSFKTDVRGANQQGMDVLYVNTGIHGGEVGRPLDAKRLRKLALAHGAIPTYAAEALNP